jgi:hypothetical protein
MRRDGHRRARRASSATFSGVSRVASLRSRRRSRQSSTGRNANSRFDNLAASTTLSSSRREQKPTLPSPRRDYRCGCVRSGVVAHHRLARLRTPRTDGPRRATRVAHQSSSATRTLCSPTPATGISARSKRSPATASKCSSLPTPACADAPARAGPATSTTPCGACSLPRRVAPCTGSAKRRSRACSGRSSSTARSAASNAATGRLCRSEWRLIAATHNLLKLHHHELGAAPA